MYDFITIDFETANRNMDSVCAVGIVAVTNQTIEKQEYFLVKPPTDEFSSANIAIHGITSEMVKDADTFDKIWENVLEKYFDESDYVIAHNAQFDMSALMCSLEAYDDRTIQDFVYIDNIHLAHRGAKEAFIGNNLEVAAEYYNVDIKNHHNALDDALAVAEIVIEILKRNDCDDLYDFIAKKDVTTKLFSELKVTRTFIPHHFVTNYTNDTIDMQHLKNLAEEIIADNSVETAEVLALKDWLDKHLHLTGYYPFDKISGLCNDILKDNIITQEEKDNMLSLLKQFTNPVDCEENKPEITFIDKLFVLTGNFETGSKKEIAEKIIAKGGQCKDGLTSKTDFLIVGGAGSDNWKFGNYGGKVAKALEFQEKGFPIVILRESDLVNWI
ncbi:MAG: hypothetical protein HFI72_07310 [Peptococcaceae bacterium]|nr:hypothetical protein [Peptococcaceae bacterium]